MDFKVPFFQHDLNEKEIVSIRKVLQQPILTTGEFVEEFERRFAEYLGCKNVVGLTSCTGALHLSLVALGIGRGDEVITTPMTFIATVMAVLQAGATVVLVDVERETGNIDLEKIEGAITDRTRAVVPVHLYGNMVNMGELRGLCDQYGLAIIEDSAHCIEGDREGIRPGELGDTACFSFYATKNITCGEGGAVATNSSEVAKKIRISRLHGMSRTAWDRATEGYHHWDVTVMGWKYNMSNLDAAFLLPQLDRIGSNHEKRKIIPNKYKEAFNSVDGIGIPETTPNTVHAHHLFPILINEHRDDFVDKMQSEGIGLVVNYRPVHLLSYIRTILRSERGDFPNAERIGDTVASLPLYPSMTNDHIEMVIHTVHGIIDS